MFATHKHTLVLGGGGSGGGGRGARGGDAPLGVLLVLLVLGGGGGRRGDGGGGGGLGQCLGLVVVGAYDDGVVLHALDGLVIPEPHPVRVPWVQELGLHLVDFCEVCKDRPHLTPAFHHADGAAPRQSHLHNELLQGARGKGAHEAVGVAILGHHQTCLASKLTLGCVVQVQPQARTQTLKETLRGAGGEVEQLWNGKESCVGW